VLPWSRLWSTIQSPFVVSRRAPSDRLKPTFVGISTVTGSGEISTPIMDGFAGGLRNASSTCSLLWFHSKANGLGCGAGQVDPARASGALCRDRHAGLHRPFPAAARRAGSSRRVTPSAWRPKRTGSPRAARDAPAPALRPFRAFHRALPVFTRRAARSAVARSARPRSLEADHIRSIAPPSNGL
jgi:hypothetical protein